MKIELRAWWKEKKGNSSKLIEIRVERKRNILLKKLVFEQKNWDVIRLTY